VRRSRCRAPWRAPRRCDRRPGLKVGFSLFWRTFFLLALLLIGCIGRLAADLSRARVRAARHADGAADRLAGEPQRAPRWSYSDAITRVSLIKTLADQEGVRILPREPNDRLQPYTTARSTSA
jgi:two-component system osmolarity sensor histidine kinase EnvZ